MNGGLAEFLSMAKNPAIPPDDRENRIMALGRQGDSEATRKLMALGNEDTYLNFAALRALGTIKHPEVTAYLETKLTNGDPRLVAAAVVSLAGAKGEASIAQIAGVLETNRLREDGHQDIVCSACIDALTELRASAALPALALELEKTVGVTLHHEYGSRVVEAIREIGDPAGVEALQAYAERLRTLKGKQSDNPKGEQYFQSKIDEVATAIVRLQQQH
jgi:HEAT repeat protein